MYPSIMPSSRKNHPFIKFARWVAYVTGRPLTFLLAIFVIVVWLITGPYFHYSDTWQLVINTGTTIITFLMVFLIQNTQNRDSVALQVKIDELLRTNEKAHNALLDLEELTEEELFIFRDRYQKLAQEARKSLQRGGSDTGSPTV
jgi:low affinity Fe/Cu permease